MNREEKITRLQGLLDRVQTRAKQGRPGPRALEPWAPATGTLGFDIMPVAMPTAEPFDSEETRPFAKMPMVPPLSARAVEPPKPDAEIGISMGASEVEIELDDVGVGGLEILGGAEDELFLEQEPGSSSRAIQIDIAEEPRVTPPPESGAQQVSVKPVERLGSQPSQLEVDDTPRERITPERPSIEMLGRTVDLPDARADATLELDRKPMVTPRPRSTGEMEAVIPGSMAPGVYPPEQAAFEREPPSTEWELPKELGTKPAIQPAAASSEVVVKQAPAQKPEALEISEAFELLKPVEGKPLVEGKPAPVEPPIEVKPAVEEPAVEEKPAELEAKATEPIELKPQEPREPAPKVEAAPPQPIHIEFAGKVIAAPEMSAADVAAFVGAIEATTPITFLDALDASLAL